MKQIVIIMIMLVCLSSSVLAVGFTTLNETFDDVNHTKKWSTFTVTKVSTNFVSGNASGFYSTSGADIINYSGTGAKWSLAENVTVMFNAKRSGVGTYGSTGYVWMGGGATGTTNKFAIEGRKNVSGIYFWEYYNGATSKWDLINCNWNNTWLNLRIRYNTKTNKADIWCNGILNLSQVNGYGGTGGSVNKTTFNGQNGAASSWWIDDIIVCENEVCAPSTASTTITITQVYLTSPNPDQKIYSPIVTGNTTDTTPTFNLSTDIVANCYQSNDNATWNVCSTTGGTEHICTEGTAFSLGFKNEYVKCNTTDDTKYLNLSIFIKNMTANWSLSPPNNTQSTSKTVSLYCNASMMDYNDKIQVFGIYYSNVSGYDLTGAIGNSTYIIIYFNSTSTPLRNYSEVINWTATFTNYQQYYWWCDLDVNFSGGSTVEEGIASPEYYINISEQIAYNLSCNYTGTGDWYVQCKDTCNLTNTTDVKTNQLIFNGTGYAFVRSKIYNFRTVKAVGGCIVNVDSSGMLG